MKAEQGLVAQTVADTLDQAGDGGGLIAGRLVVGMQFERGV